MIRPKTRNQMEDKANELCDRLWYYRHINWATDWENTPSDIRETAALKAQQIAALYPEEVVRDAENPARLEGWIAAIRWVLDPRATETTDYLYDS
jgi:hypothetical protein